MADLKLVSAVSRVAGAGVVVSVVPVVSPELSSELVPHAVILNSIRLRAVALINEISDS